jgi:hypothetical protein
MVDPDDPRPMKPFLRPTHSHTPISSPNGSHAIAYSSQLLMGRYSSAAD